MARAAQSQINQNSIWKRHTGAVQGWNWAGGGDSRIVYAENPCGIHGKKSNKNVLGKKVCKVKGKNDFQT